jgi:xylose isomerase
MRILMRDIGMTMYVINKVKEKGVDTTNLKVNMDWQHLIMNGENLAEYASLLASENLLGHQHGNSGWGSFDDDNMVGASFFMQTLELALTLRRYGYGRNGERVGFDLFPYTEDQVAAVKRSIYQWDFIDSLAGKIDDKALNQAQASHDAVAAYNVIYKTLGLDDKFIQAVHAGRKKK